MPKLAPLDDIKTYRDVADAAYAKKFSQGVHSPVQATKARVDSAESAAVTPTDLAKSPAAVIPGVKFTKGFSPAERALQAKSLEAKLRARALEDKAERE